MSDKQALSLEDIKTVATLNGHSVGDTLYQGNLVAIRCASCHSFIYSNNNYTLSGSDWQRPCGDGLVRRVKKTFNKLNNKAPI